ncbi:MAG: PLDc N-terminal domain-containing protein [Caldilineaceae bacterium]
MKPVDPLLFSLLLDLVGLLCLVFWGGILLDCMFREPEEGTERLVWGLFIGVTHILGAAVYLLFRRPRRIRLHGQ